MKRIFTIVIMVIFSYGLFIAQTNSSNENIEKRAGEIWLQFVKDIPLPGAANRFDYETIDKVERRLYISHMGSNSVIVFDLDSQKIIVNVSDIPRPTGILAVPKLHCVYVSASEANKVIVISTATQKKVAEISSLGFPDGIAYDPVNKRIFVSNEYGKAVTVIDAVKNRLIKNIDMGGEVGNTHYDSVSKLIYSAVQTRNELVGIDLNTLKITGRYLLQDCNGPHGFYIDDKIHYAFITGEKDVSYVVFDLTLHKTIAKGRVGSDPDVLAFDEQMHRLYVSSESGIVSVFILERNRIEKFGEMYFAPNVHTVSVDSKTHFVYFPLQNVNGKPILRIMKSNS